MIKIFENIKKLKREILSLIVEFLAFGSVTIAAIFGTDLSKPLVERIMMIPVMVTSITLMIIIVWINLSDQYDR